MVAFVFNRVDGLACIPQTLKMAYTATITYTVKRIGSVVPQVSSAMFKNIATLTEAIALAQEAVDLTKAKQVHATFNIYDDHSRITVCYRGTPNV